LILGLFLAGGLVAIGSVNGEKLCRTRFLEKSNTVSDLIENAVEISGSINRVGLVDLSEGPYASIAELEPCDGCNEYGWIVVKFEEYDQNTEPPLENGVTITEFADFNLEIKKIDVSKGWMLTKICGK
jgi:hypothetical protein